MFGYYALLCLESREFWQDVNRLSPYWMLFSDFAVRCKPSRTTSNFAVTTSGSEALGLKPTPGLEPGTPSLRMKCSTN